MKLALKTLIAINLVLVFLALYRLRDLISLLNDNGFFPDVFTESELAPVTYHVSDPETNTTVPDRPLLIPKIIHQTYKTEKIPEKWIDQQKSCLERNPEYKYILWTDESARDFINEHYNWFLPTFDSYPYNIMRADAIRYFVLSHFGGIYIDLDNGCDLNLDPLLTVPGFLRKTDPTGVSNDIMGSIPKHHFFLKVIGALERFNRNWVISYITIMYSTGPLFLSVMWKQYLRAGVPRGNEIRILLPVDHAKHTSSFFNQAEGSSWHQSDAKYIILMGQHWIIATIVGTIIGFSILYAEYKLIQVLLRVFFNIKSRSRSMGTYNPRRIFGKLYNSFFSSRKKYSMGKRDKDNNSPAYSDDEESYYANNSDDYNSEDFYDEDVEKPKLFFNDNKSQKTQSKTTFSLSSLPIIGEFFGSNNKNSSYSKLNSEKPHKVQRKSSNRLLKTYHRKFRQRSASLLLPSFHNKKTASTIVYNDNTSTGEDSDLELQRIPVNSNVAKTPFITVQEDYDDNFLKVYPKQAMNVSTVSLNSSLNEDSNSTYSITPVSSHTASKNDGSTSSEEK